jgi:transposase
MRVPVRRDNVRENLNIVVDLPKDLVVSCSNRVERGCGAVANEPNRRPQVVLLAGSGLVPRQGCGRLRRLLDRWPTLELARRARRETLTDFFRAHNVRNQASIERRLEAIRIEQSLTNDPAAIVPMRLLVEALLPQLRAACAAIARFDVEIARLCPELPDYELFRALPGAGPALAPRLLVAFGERRERFPNAAALQKYAGVAPVTERSGNKSWVHWRYSCPKFLRQSFIEWVAQTIPRSFWAHAFYKSCRARGMRHQAALRALAFKWIRILYRCWVERKPYDESRYLLALQKRQAPLLKFAAATPD